MKNLLLTILLIFSIPAISQERDRNALMQQYQNMNFTVSGQVLDIDTGQPLEYATILLSNQLKKDEITGGITAVSYTHLTLPTKA